MNIKTRPLTQAEFQVLIWNCTPYWKAVYLLAYSTGLRISDLLQLPNDPCPANIILCEKKTRRLNTIKVNNIIRDSWEQLRLNNNTKHLLVKRDVSTYRKSLVKHCKLAGIDTHRIAFHSLRKTTATTIYNSLGFVAASQYLNHAKPSTTMNYIEIDGVQIGSALEGLFHLNSSKDDVR